MRTGWCYAQRLAVVRLVSGARPPCADGAAKAGAQLLLPAQLGSLHVYAIAVYGLKQHPTGFGVGPQSGARLDKVTVAVVVSRQFQLGAGAAAAQAGFQCATAFGLELWVGNSAHIELGVFKTDINVLKGRCAKALGILRKKFGVFAQGP